MIVDTPSFDRLLRGDAVERYKYFMEATDLVSINLIAIILQFFRCAHRVVNASAVTVCLLFRFVEHFV
jgi:hypothetical protein